MEEYKHSEVLFTDDDGTSLEFYIPYQLLNKNRNLKDLIEHGSGIVMPSPGQNIINLIEKDSRVINFNDNQKTVYVQYIFDCVKENKLLNTDDYSVIIKSHDVSGFDDSTPSCLEDVTFQDIECTENDMINNLNKSKTDKLEIARADKLEKFNELNENREKISKPVTKKKIVNDNYGYYTVEEDENIIKFLIGYVDSCSFRSKWHAITLMAEKQIVNRTFKSIEKRLIRILSNLSSFNLTVDQERKLRRLDKPIRVSKRFSNVDDLKIIQYIIKHKAYDKTQSDWIFKQMLKDKIVKDKSSQRLQHYFEKQIIPNLKNYNISPVHIELLKTGFINNSSNCKKIDDIKNFKDDLTSDSDEMENFNAIEKADEVELSKDCHNTSTLLEDDDKLDSHTSDSNQKSESEGEFFPESSEEDIEFFNRCKRLSKPSTKRPKSKSPIIFKTRRKKSRCSDDDDFDFEKKPLKEERLSGNDVYNIDNISVDSRENFNISKISNKDYQNSSNVKTKLTKRSSPRLKANQEKILLCYDADLHPLSLPNSEDINAATSSKRGLQNEFEDSAVSVESGSLFSVKFEDSDFIPSSANEDSQTLNISYKKKANKIKISNLSDKMRVSNDDNSYLEQLKKFFKSEANKRMQERCYELVLSEIQKLGTINFSKHQDPELSQKILLEHINKLNFLVSRQKLHSDVKDILLKTTLSIEDKCTLWRFLTSCKMIKPEKMFSKNIF